LAGSFLPVISDVKCAAGQIIGGAFVCGPMGILVRRARDIHPRAKSHSRPDCCALSAVHKAIPPGYQVIL
jgi:hypothetical protein